MVYATHNRAGEITYRSTDPNNCLTYEITVTTYTKSDAVDRCEITIFFGDGDSCVASRVNGNPAPSSQGCPGSASPGFCQHCGEYLDNSVKKNVYVCTHTYQGPGNYTISMYDENRNGGVVNIINSINVPFYIEAQLFINPFLGCNTTPILLNPPIDNACTNICFYHNAGAYDPDGDSLSYRIVPCSGTDGLNIPNNPGPYNVVMNQQTGDFVWCKPTSIGEYNFAFIIEEWRRIPGDTTAYLVGNVKRDMQVTVTPCNNNPPVIIAPLEICVRAGDTVQFDVKATDPDNDQLTLTGTGGPLIMPNPATFPQPTYGTGAVLREFKWITACSHVQINPHYMYFRAEDDGGPMNIDVMRLATYHTTAIRVVGPEPLITEVSPLGSNMRINWDASICSEVTSYKIYRHIGATGWQHDTCETGCPAYTGYVQIGETIGLNNTQFTDNNGGLGLVNGVQYCYRVVAIFGDGAESYCSDEMCASLKKDIPIITNVSIFNTDETAGADTVIWSKPTELDTIAFPGPYHYNLYRAAGINGTNFQKVWEQTYPDFYLMNDSIFVEPTGLNTLDSAYRYKIELVNKTAGIPNDTIGNTKASSVYLKTIPSDNQLTLVWDISVPWTNYQAYVYRRLPGASAFQFVDTTFSTSFVDTGLANGQTYCYFIRTEGTYSSPAIDSILINTSQVACGIPQDTTRPCPPDLTVSPSCDEFKNSLSWNPKLSDCANDALYYKVYFSPTLAGDWQLLYTTSDLNDSAFVHPNLLQSIAGCYAVAAVDSFSNESYLTDSVCVDNCPQYQLPNTFSPDGDGINDLFNPFLGWRFIKTADVKIFNRWGNLIFETTEPAISWNGKINNTGADCSDGVYFYVCEAEEIRLSGNTIRQLKGFIHLFRNSNGAGF